MSLIQELRPSLLASQPDMSYLVSFYSIFLPESETLLHFLESYIYAKILRAKVARAGADLSQWRSGKGLAWHLQGRWFDPAQVKKFLKGLSGTGNTLLTFVSRAGGGWILLNGQRHEEAT